MRKEDKNTLIEQLTAVLQQYSHFYLTETASLNAEKTSELRRACFKEGIKMLVVKNTLLQKAMLNLEVDYSPLFDSLKGSTTVLFSDTANAPAKLIKEFKKTAGLPELKAAYVEESFYIGADQLDALIAVKSKNELIADVISLLQSPAKNVVSALQSGGSTIHGVLQTLSER